MRDYTAATAVTVVVSVAVAMTESKTHTHTQKIAFPAFRRINREIMRHVLDTYSAGQ